jgi:hypothetical protein
LRDAVPVVLVPLRCICTSALYGSPIMNRPDFGGPDSAVSIADDTTPENEKSKIDAASAGPAVAVKSDVKAASKRCLIAIPFKDLASRRGTVGLLFNYGGGQALSQGSERFSLRRPSTRCWEKRWRHLPTVALSRLSLAATSLFCAPSAPANTIRALSASTCAVLRRLASDSSSDRSSSLSPRRANCRPSLAVANIPMAQRCGTMRI